MPLDFHQKVLSEVTQLDERKRRQRGPWNPYFLGIVCRDALPAIDECLEQGMSEAEAFAEAFTPSREMHSVARRLELPLDVDRGRWVITA
jgi:hypothetical protein